MQCTLKDLHEEQSKLGEVIPNIQENVTGGKDPLGNFHDDEDKSLDPFLLMLDHRQSKWQDKIKHTGFQTRKK